METEVPRFRGINADGVEEQVARARLAPMTTLGVMLADNQVLERFNSKSHMMERSDAIPCGCKICETGTIDNSACSKVHLIFPVPMINVWSDKATSLLLGAGHLIFWSAWARPAVLGLSARAPTVTQVRVLLSKTHVRMKHTFLRYHYRVRHEDELNCDVIDIIPKPFSDSTYPRVHEFLASLPGQWRIGRHLLLQSSTDSSTALETGL